jgi:hypothetical protein
LLSRERRLESIGESDQKFALIAGWRPRDDADRAAGMNQRIIRPAPFDPRYDLRPCKNVVRLMRHDFRASG